MRNYMEIDANTIREALRKILRVERDHIFGATVGSQSARRQALEKVVDGVLKELTESPPKG